jgi:phytoene dehydrogenase-like protein
MENRFDAALIGAGRNSLAAALDLSARGWSVGVFEQAPVAGGAVTTGGYTLPGFRHDRAAMNVPLFAGRPIFKACGKKPGRHGRALMHVGRPLASGFPDVSWAGV